MKYTFDYIENILNNYGYKLIEYNNSKNIIALDSKGFKYKLNLCNLQYGKKPNITQKNPFAIYNIKNYISMKFPDIELISDEYINCKSKLKFICNKHIDKGIQEKTFDDICNCYQCCKYCSIDERSIKYRINDEIIKKRCKELSLNFIKSFIKNNETWVQFICPKHENKGIQEISWYHLKTCSVGCPYCTGRYKTTEDFINEMKIINPDIEIIGEYNGCENHIKCKCKKCGYIWNPIGRSLKYKNGCPHCNMSKGENNIAKYLQSKNIKFLSQYTFSDCKYISKLRFDFYLPSYNIIIEYDGEQHFKPVDFANKGIDWANNLYRKNKIKDYIKNEYCKKNNIKLIRIPYYDFNNIEMILQQNI